MPLRPFSSPLLARLQKAFHTSAIRRDASTQPNHYETLQIPTNASPSEVKKSVFPLYSNQFMFPSISIPYWKQHYSTDRILDHSTPSPKPTTQTSTPPTHTPQNASLKYQKHTLSSALQQRDNNMTGTSSPKHTIMETTTTDLTALTRVPTLRAGVPLQA
jgi:hypothetical protein